MTDATWPQPGSEASEQRRAAWRRLELPTWAVAASVYAGWAALTYWHRALPWWLLAPLGAAVVAWHGSLQHEALHGHPTRSARANAVLAGVPLALWLPYAIYRENHLAHHRTAALTDPLDDPESYYVSPDEWRAMGAARRAVRWALATLVGRVTLGPAWMVWRFAASEVRLLARGDRRRLAVWAAHLALCAGVLAWVAGACGMSLARYVACFVYPGLALTLVRSFAEHRPAAAQAHRTAVVEAGWPFALLFLNNNLHAVHHRAPSLPWFELPARYRAERAAVLDQNGGFLLRGYAAVAARWALRPKDHPAHPGSRGGP